MDNRVAYCFAVICGVTFAYGLTYLQCIALLIFPIACAQQGKSSLVTLFLFFATASIPVLAVVSNYTESTLLSLPPYFAMVFMNCAVVSYALSQKKLPVLLSVPLALVFLSLPPIAFINPITMLPLAGWLFPGFGILGIVLMLTIVGITCEVTRNKITKVVYVMSLLVPLSVAHAESRELLSVQVFSEPVTAISISRPYDANLNSAMMRVAYRFEELDLIQNIDSDISVLPESVFGEWQITDGKILSASEGTVFGGARVYIDERRYRNVVVNGKTGDVVYEQMNPPFIKTNKPSVAVKGRGNVMDTGLSFLICYELTNSLIVYNAYNQNDNPVIWLSNLSWSKSDYLKRRMDSLHSAWSRLYSKQQHSAVMTNA